MTVVGWKLILGFIMVVAVSGSLTSMAEEVKVEEEFLFDEDALYAAEVKEEQLDLDGDGVKELIRVTWQSGVSNKPIRVEVFRNHELVQTLGPVMAGIQSNYTFKDTDGDGKQELIIWSGLWDFRLPGEEGMKEQGYEGHSGSHRYIVATYKWMRDNFRIWDIYTTKEKYEPYPERVPE